MALTGTKFGVIGVGKYGATIAKSLAKKGAEVIAIDVYEDRIDAIKDDVALAITLDSTDIKALESQNIQDLDAVIVAIGENFQAVILTAVNLMELNTKRIIARASGKQQKLILEKIGIAEILTPEDEVATLVAERLMNPSVVSFLQFPDGYEIAEVKAPKAIANKSIEEIGLRNKYQLTLVTIKREFEQIEGGEKKIKQHIIGVPNSETVIYESDTIVLFGTEKDIEKFIEINR